MLAEVEIGLLQRALLEWGGPARCGDEMAVALGFSGFTDLLGRSDELRALMAEDAPIPGADWARILLASEIVFISDLSGSGVDWSVTTGLTDEATVVMFRSVQRKLAPVVRAYYGRRPQ